MKSRIKRIDDASDKQRINASGRTGGRTELWLAQLKDMSQEAKPKKMRKLNAGEFLGL